MRSSPRLKVWARGGEADRAIWPKRIPRSSRRARVRAGAQIRGWSGRSCDSRGSRGRRRRRGRRRSPAHRGKLSLERPRPEGRQPVGARRAGSGHDLDQAVALEPGDGPEQGPRSEVDGTPFLEIVPDDQRLTRAGGQGPEDLSRRPREPTELIESRSQGGHPTPGLRRRSWQRPRSPGPWGRGSPPTPPSDRRSHRSGRNRCRHPRRSS